MDKPLGEQYPGPGKTAFDIKTDKRFEKFTRVEVFGETDTHWVKVHVDLNDPNIFTVAPQLVNGTSSRTFRARRPLPPTASTKRTSESERAPSLLSGAFFAPVHRSSSHFSFTRNTTSSPDSPPPEHSPDPRKAEQVVQNAELPNAVIALMFAGCRRRLKANDPPAVRLVRASGTRCPGFRSRRLGQDETGTNNMQNCGSLTPALSGSYKVGSSPYVS